MPVMARRPVPQPLALEESRAPGSEPCVGETGILPAASPSETKSVNSPRSPRSPFSKFNPNQKRSMTATFGGPRSTLSSDTLQHTHDASSPAEDIDFLPPIASAVHPSYGEQRANPPVIRQKAQQPQRPPQPPSQPQREEQQQQPQAREQHEPSQHRLRGQQQQRELQQQGHGHGHSQNRHDEDKASKSGFFFNFGKSAKSSDRVNSHQHTDSRSETMSKDTNHAGYSKQNSSQRSEKPERVYNGDNGIQRSAADELSRSDLSLASGLDIDTAGNIRRASPAKFTETERSYATPLRTAPIHSHDRSFREMMSSSARNRSVDRTQSSEMSEINKGRETQSRDSGREHSREREFGRVHASSFKDNGAGSAFLSGLKNSGSKAADMLSKGLFGKAARAGGSEREPIVDDEHYQLKVINLPLVEQTRRTRISKRLEESRDKTEFWMPAFPWRAIDYLNYKGSDVEGLYRVPGSGPQIKRWQRRFDEEGDVDLFEQKDLYDINIIGSMLKAWLRELPDELFPKDAQDRIARECAGSETVPPQLIEELSNLSPFKYYLLFAITCHLSLLLAHSDKNKMDFRNLCICFQPCMKIDAFCFKFLVCDWRDCWKGCKNEAKYIEEEYALFDQPPPMSIGQPQKNDGGQGDDRQADRPDKPNESNKIDRNLATEDRAKQQVRSSEKKSRLRKKAQPENGSIDGSSSISTTITVNSDRDSPPRTNDIRPLSPIKPLSPLGF